MIPGTYLITEIRARGLRRDHTENAPGINFNPSAIGDVER
jgi:hypothetical protein